MLKRAIGFINPEFDSQAHGKTFNLRSFYDFVVLATDAEALLAGPVEYDPMSVIAAQFLLDNNDFELRDKEDYDPIKSCLISTYLPLASHTQFVEAGVKEAKIVSQSDQSEQLRSAYAIIRSASLHSIGVVRDLSSNERIQKLIKSAQQHVNASEELQQDQPNYLELINAIVTSMRKEHFKQERVNMLVATAINKGSVNKKDNAIQKKRGVDTTLVMLGLIPYGKLLKQEIWTQ